MGVAAFAAVDAKMAKAAVDAILVLCEHCSTKHTMFLLTKGVVLKPPSPRRSIMSCLTP